MLTKSVRIFILCFLLIPTLIFSKSTPQKSTLSSIQNQMLGDLAIIDQLFKTTYAPMDWKENYFHFSFQQDMESARNKIIQNPLLSTKEFQKLIIELVGALKDYHVVVYFYSTEYSFLPFDIKCVEDRFFVTVVYDEDLSLAVGDEIISFGNQPIKKAFEAFKNENIVPNVKETDQGLAELYFTQRSGSFGHIMEKGSIVIKFKSLKLKKNITTTLKWNYKEELISNVPKKYNPAWNVFSKSLKNVNVPKKTAHFKQPLYIKKSFSSPYHQKIKIDKRIASNTSIGEGGLLPPLGKVLWTYPSDEFFQSYYFALPNGKKCGFIKIDSYEMSDNAKAIEDFIEIIEILERETDYLVIDQLDNTGGSAYFLYAILSHLTDYPLQLPQHRTKLTQKEVYDEIDMKDLISMIEKEEDSSFTQFYMKYLFEGWVPNSGTLQKIKASCSRTLDQWNAGKIFTDLAPLDGVDVVEPHPTTRYTKPLLILVNSQCFSCGDFFPAIMQDNKRAKIMGQRTAGAGGYIANTAFPNLTGINELILTMSIATRSNGQPIESLGITPDIPYEISVKDLQNKYSDYVQAILKEISLE